MRGGVLEYGVGPEDAPSEKTGHGEEAEGTELGARRGLGRPLHLELGQRVYRGPQVLVLRHLVARADPSFGRPFFEDREIDGPIGLAVSDPQKPVAAILCPGGCVGVVRRHRFSPSCFRVSAFHRRTFASVISLSMSPKQPGHMSRWNSARVLRSR